ncbi:hypothetical protein HGA92_06050 [Candidatus Gracilibacteria bacterium]|nr:hypothetical protein [Candidatus Gracilibacteria bacterium]
MKQIIYKDKKDFERFFIYILKEQKNYPSVKLVSYCILPNHFHFIVQATETGLQISDFMRKIQGSYAMYFKTRYKNETGLIKTPVFEGRFKAKLIDDEPYLFQCMLYVNYNAQKHQIVNNIADYPYTSYHQIIGRQARDIISADDINQDFMKLDFTQIDLAELEF